MGQICISAEDQQRLIDLEISLKEQELEKEEWRQKLEDARATHEANRDGDTYSSEKIEQLQNEKKQLFKTMLKEKKHVSKLEDEIDEYKRKMKRMEKNMKTLTQDKKKQARAKRLKQEKEKQKQEKERIRREKKEREAKKRSLERSTSSGAKKQPFAGLGSVMDGIKMPNLGNLNLGNLNLGNLKIPLPGVQNEATTEPLPFKVKNVSVSSDHTSDDHDADRGTTDYGSTDESDSDDSKYQVIQMQDTILLDIGYDAESEATHVYSWLHGKDIGKNKRAIKQLKQRLASMLTARSEGYRQTLIEAYRAEYGLNLEKDIKKIIVKGHAMEIIHGLLMTRAQYDAILISECVANWDIEPVADIICCRSIGQLKELHAAYKKKCKLDVKKQLQALAQKDKKKTLVKVIGGIFDLKRKEVADVDMNAVNLDLNFVLTTKSFKGETKEKLVLIFTTNSVQYIKVLNEQFKLKSKDSLTTFMDKKLGPKSTAGHFCKTRILYALDTPDYYAQKIKKLGYQYKKNQKRIADIFIQRMEIDLDIIQRVWKVKKYGDGKDLRTWIMSKTSGSKSGEFLCKMLDNCGRYAEFNKKNDPKNTKQGGRSKFEKMMM